jgi:hypothetical protein
MAIRFCIPAVDMDTKSMDVDEGAMLSMVSEEDVASSPSPVPVSRKDSGRH